MNVKDGGKYAFLGMESREAGDAVIEALHLQVTTYNGVEVFFVKCNGIAESTFQSYLIYLTTLLLIALIRR